MVHEVEAARVKVGDRDHKEVNREIRNLVREGAKLIEVEEPRGIHYLAAGLEANVEIVVRGTLGYYAGALAHGIRMAIDGDAGWYAGDNLTKGEIIVDGDAGNGPGQYLVGGTVVVRGDVGDRPGALMRRGMLIVGGSTGIMAGLYMMGGTMLILGDAGESLGEMIIGGEIFIAGGVEGLGKNASILEATEEDVRRANELIARYGFKERNSYYLVRPKSRRPIYSPRRPMPGVKAPLMPRYRVEILQDTCIACGICYNMCPEKVFVKKGGHVYPTYVERCVGCYTCMKYCPTGSVRVYPLQDLRRGYWNIDQINYAQSLRSTGVPMVRGMGTREIELPGLDDLVIVPAQLSRPPIDSYREPCDTDVVLGRRFAERPLRLRAPMVIGAMSFGSISREAKIAIARAATRLGIAVNTGEGGMLPEERAEASTLIAQYASARFGVSAAYLKAADAVEIKIGQGAKPGQGGLLLGEKVTEEISEMRGIPAGADAISPARHLDIVGPEDLKMKIDELREVTGWRVPIAVKIAAGRVEDDVKIVAKAGADIVVVDAKPAGTGASPHIVTEHAGIPTIAAVVEANRVLKELGLRDKVSLVVSGGVRNGADVAKLLALGADSVAIGTLAVVGLGCTMCGLCSTGRCPSGIATQNPRLRKRLNVARAADSLENLLRSVIKEACMLAQLAGKTSLKNLEKEDLRALTPKMSAIAGVKLVGRETVTSA